MTLCLAIASLRKFYIFLDGRHAVLSYFRVLTGFLQNFHFVKSLQIYSL